MLAFTLAYAAVLAALYAFGFWHGAQWLGNDTDAAVRLALVLVALPAATAWAVAEGVHALTPRRFFDHRVRAWVRRPTLGLIAGLLTATAAALLLPLLDQHVADGVVMSACATVFTILAVGTQARLRRGRCVNCGYDLRDLTSHARGRCPECGACGSVHRPVSGRTAASRESSVPAG